MSLLPATISAVVSILGQSRSEPMSAWEGVRGAFQHSLPQAEGQASPLKTTLIFVGILLGVVLVFYVAARLMNRSGVVEKVRPPNRFFAHLLREMGVGWLDRFLLLRAARRSRLPQPAIIMLAPVLFEKHAGTWADSLNMALRGFVRARLAHVSAIAFPSPTTDPLNA
jgi:hypothetical protein